MFDHTGTTPIWYTIPMAMTPVQLIQAVQTYLNGFRRLDLGVTEPVRGPSPELWLHIFEHMVDNRARQHYPCVSYTELTRDSCVQHVQLYGVPHVSWALHWTRTRHPPTHTWTWDCDPIDFPEKYSCGPALSRPLHMWKMLFTVPSPEFVSTTAVLGNMLQGLSPRQSNHLSDAQYKTMVAQLLSYAGSQTKLPLAAMVQHVPVGEHMRETYRQWCRAASNPEGSFPNHMHHWMLDTLRPYVHTQWGPECWQKGLGVFQGCVGATQVLMDATPDDATTLPGMGLGTKTHHDYMRGTTYAHLLATLQHLHGGWDAFGLALQQSNYREVSEYIGEALLRITQAISGGWGEPRVFRESPSLSWKKTLKHSWTEWATTFVEHHPAPLASHRLQTLAAYKALTDPAQWHTSDWNKGLAECMRRESTLNVPTGDTGMVDFSEVSP